MNPVQQIRQVAARLYSENRLSGDEMRNLAQRLDGIAEELTHLLATPERKGHHEYT